jgi:hypothetical protein
MDEVKTEVAHLFLSPSFGRLSYLFPQLAQEKDLFTEMAINRWYKEGA